MYHLSRQSAVKLASAVCAAGLLVAMTAGWVVADGGITINVRDVALKEVLNLLTRQSKTNIVIADEAKLEKRVTASLTDVSLDKAFEYLLTNSGVDYSKLDDGTYIVGGSAASKPVVTMTDVKESLPPIEVDLPVAPVEALAPEPRIITTPIPLIHSTPSELMRLINDPDGGALPALFGPGRSTTRTSSRDRRTGSGIVTIMDGRGGTYDPIGRTRTEGYQPVVPTVDPTGDSYTAKRSIEPTLTAAQFAAPGGVPGYPIGAAPPAMPGTTPGAGRTTPATSTPGGTSTNTGNFLWPEGIEDARPFDLLNFIIVKGTLEGIEEFKNIIHKLDIPPKQVQIKADFVEVKTTDVERFGIDWSLQRLNESFNTGFSPSGNVIVGFATGNLTASLKAQLGRDVGRIINSPIISTMNNQTASISISTQIPYWVTTTTVDNGTVVNNSTPEFINIDSALDVQPRVNGDGSITMMLMPQVSDTGNLVTGPDGQSIPEQRSEQLMTIRRLRNGETIVVGGFVRKNDSNSYQKIPILADLPIVGSLFRTTANTKEDRELLIFVTATVLPDDEVQLAGGTGGGLVP